MNNEEQIKTIVELESITETLIALQQISINNELTTIDINKLLNSSIGSLITITKKLKEVDKRSSSPFQFSISQIDEINLHLRCATSTVNYVMSYNDDEEHLLEDIFYLPLQSLRKINEIINE